VAALLDVSDDELSDEELQEIKRIVDERRRQYRAGDSP
jgi:hypothetical protein